MASIATEAESDIDYKRRFFDLPLDLKTTITSAISHATCTTALDLGASAILTITRLGKTAQFVSKYRPSCPIIAVTSDQTVLRQLNLLWGVIPLYMKNSFNDLNQLSKEVIKAASDEKLIKDGDLVVITAGLPMGKVYGTNFLKVHLVGDILISGHGITTASAQGRLCVCKTEEEAYKKFKSGDILVIPATSNNILNIMKDASAIITEVSEENSHAAVVGIALDKPVIIGAKNATHLLKDDLFVTVNAFRGIVFTNNLLNTL